VGHAWSAFGAHTATLLRRWEDKHPETPLELLRIDDRTAGLAAGKVDVAVLRGTAADDGFHTERLLSEPRVAAVSTSHPLACRASLTLADFTDTTVAVNTVAVSPPHHYGRRRIGRRAPSTSPTPTTGWRPSRPTAPSGSPRSRLRVSTATRV
jgi:DNA-binding transcriptional LysR family regulator